MEIQEKNKYSIWCVKESTFILNQMILSMDQFIQNVESIIRSILFCIEPDTSEMLLLAQKNDINGIIKIIEQNEI